MQPFPPHFLHRSILLTARCGPPFHTKIAAMLGVLKTSDHQNVYNCQWFESAKYMRLRGGIINTTSSARTVVRTGPLNKPTTGGAGIYRTGTWTGLAPGCKLDVAIGDKGTAPSAPSSHVSCVSFSRLHLSVGSVCLSDVLTF